VKKKKLRWKRKKLADELADILEKLPEEAAQKIMDKETKGNEEILAEFPPPPEPSGDDADDEPAEPPPPVDPMPKLLKEIELQKELLQKRFLA